MLYINVSIIISQTVGTVAIFFPLNFLMGGKYVSAAIDHAVNYNDGLFFVVAGFHQQCSELLLCLRLLSLFKHEPTSLLFH